MYLRKSQTKPCLPCSRIPPLGWMGATWGLICPVHFLEQCLGEIQPAPPRGHLGPGVGHCTVWLETGVCHQPPPLCCWHLLRSQLSPWICSSGGAQRRQASGSKTCLWNLPPECSETPRREIGKCKCYPRWGTIHGLPLPIMVSTKASPCSYAKVCGVTCVCKPLGEGTAYAFENLILISRAKHT